MEKLLVKFTTVPVIFTSRSELTLANYRQNVKKKYLRGVKKEKEIWIKWSRVKVTYLSTSERLSFFKVFKNTATWNLIYLLLILYCEFWFLLLYQEIKTYVFIICWNGQEIRKSTDKSNNKAIMTVSNRMIK